MRLCARVCVGLFNYSVLVLSRCCCPRRERGGGGGGGGGEVDSDSLFKAREDILGVCVCELFFLFFSLSLSLFSFFLFVDMLKGFLGRVNSAR